MNIQERQMAAGRATDLLKALASRNRLLLLCHLLDGEKSVGELARLLEVRDPAVSQQLALLRKDGLVRTRRQGQTRSEEHTSELQSLMRNSYAVFCLKKKNKKEKP